MKNNQTILFLVILALVLWIYFNNRQGVAELYNPEKIELINYITEDDFQPDAVKMMISKMTDDGKVADLAYTLAKEGKYNELFELVDNYFPEL